MDFPLAEWKKKYSPTTERTKKLMFVLYSPWPFIPFMFIDAIITLIRNTKLKSFNNDGHICGRCCGWWCRWRGCHCCCCAGRFRCSSSRNFTFFIFWIGKRCIKLSYNRKCANAAALIGCIYKRMHSLGRRTILAHRLRVHVLHKWKWDRHQYRTGDEKPQQSFLVSQFWILFFFLLHELNMKIARCRRSNYFTLAMVECNAHRITILFLFSMLLFADHIFIILLYHKRALVKNTTSFRGSLLTGSGVSVSVHAISLSVVKNNWRDYSRLQWAFLTIWHSSSTTH